MSNFTLPSGTATITALAVLENPKSSDSPKTLHFDAQLFCIDDKDESDSCGILASLRYFNIKNYTFNELGAYFLIANVVRVNTDQGAPNVASDGLSNEDYCLVGDIVSLIPASMGEVDGQHYPFVEATGYVTSAQKDEKTKSLSFELAPEPYIYAYKEYNKTPGVKKASLPLSCVIEDSARWQFRSMPNLQIGHIITVSGLLTRVSRDGGKLSGFHLTNINQLAILAKTTLPIATANASPNPLKRKEGPLKFSFTTSAKKPRSSTAPQGGSSLNSQLS